MRSQCQTRDTEETYRVAEALWQQEREADAGRMLDEVLARDPSHIDATFLLARLRQSRGQLDYASAGVAYLCRLLGYPDGLTFRCVQFIHHCHRHELAEQLCTEAMQAQEHSAPELLVLAGNIARELGRFDVARRHYLAALDGGIDLNTWYVTNALASLQKYSSSTHSDFVLHERAYGNNMLSARARAAAGFGLAKACDDVQDFCRAAEVLRESNAAVWRLAPCKQDLWYESTRRTSRRFVQLSDDRANNLEPVFVVGMPRTGTTLIAAQLSAYVGVHDRGELPHLGFIADRLLHGSLHRDADALKEARDLYVSHVRQDDAPARWYIDQNPLNFRYLDLIAALFPQAHVIHCTRDRRDNVVSLWRQDFAHPDYAFAYDFVGIRAAAEVHDSLMNHGKASLSLEVRAVAYEDLVRHPIQVIDELRDFIGIPEHTAKNAMGGLDAITSASMWQARQPIYQSSVGHWRNYKAYVPELEDF